MIPPSEHGRYRFNSIADFEQIAIFFGFHESLLFCIFMCFYGYRYRTDSFMDFCFATVFIRTFCTLISCKEYLNKAVSLHSCFIIVYYLLNFIWLIQVYPRHNGYWWVCLRFIGSFYIKFRIRCVGFFAFFVFFV